MGKGDIRGDKDREHIRDLASHPSKSSHKPRVGYLYPWPIAQQALGLIGTLFLMDWTFRRHLVKRLCHISTSDDSLGFFK